MSILIRIILSIEFDGGFGSRLISSFILLSQSFRSFENIEKSIGLYYERTIQNKVLLLSLLIYVKVIRLNHRIYSKIFNR